MVGEGLAEEYVGVVAGSGGGTVGECSAGKDNL